MSKRKSNEKKISRRAVVAASKRTSRQKNIARRAVVAALGTIDLNDPMRFLRPKHTAALLGIHIITVHKWAAKGIRLPHFDRLAPGVVGHWAQKLKKHLEEYQQSNSAA